MHYTDFKRLFDILFSLILLIILSWMFVLVVLAYAFTFQFPMLFYQLRAGKDERPFRLVKFRTLGSDGKPFALGTFLRRTSIDELPQLFQVLSGKLSFIGPRPLPKEYLPLYSSEQRRRHAVRPGITGWAQVNGRHSISWQRKFELDLYYVDHISAGLDFRIFMKTIGLLLSFDKDRSLEEKKFTGS